MNSETEPRPLTFIAPDGVELVGAATGEGPPLAFVYGAMMEQTGWARLLPYLPGRTLYTYDRRGRGESGDVSQYTVEREVDDLVTFAEAMPAPRDLFAHSSGALLALHALMRGLSVRRVVLYEPPMAAMRDPVLPLDLADRVDALLAQGDRDGALSLFFQEGMEQLAEGIQRLRDGPRWQDQLRYVHTGAYDVRITRSFVVDPNRLARIDMPVLLLLGSESPRWMKRGVEAFARAVPNSRLETLEGQGHNAQFSAPDVLAAAMTRFLDE